LIRISSIQLFEACFQEGSPEGEDATLELVRKMIKQKSNEFEAQLCDFEVVTSKDNNHKLIHTIEFIGICFDS
jgi:hypothetical protein